MQDEQPVIPQPVFLDALNYLDTFFKYGASQKDPWAELYRAQQRIATLSRAFRLSGRALTIVVDVDTKSAHAARKWRTRRERELRQCHRRVVLGVDAFVCEAFAKQGVPAVCSRGADADDVLAALAFCTNGVVLSRDSDFTSCYNKPLCVASSWQQTRGRIELVTETSSVPQRPTRAIQPELAEKAQGHGCVWEFRPEMKYRPSFTAGRGRRGTTSSSDAIMGSLHRLTAPLRLVGWPFKSNFSSRAVLVLSIGTICRPLPGS